jgi:RNA polymerase sigma factor (sigma-70 family)
MEQPDTSPKSEAKKRPLTIAEAKLVSDSAFLAQNIAASMSRKYDPGFLDPNQALSDAYLGLIEAARQHDPSTGPFEAYAATCCRNKIIDGIRKEYKRGTSPSRANGGIINLDILSGSDELSFEEIAPSTDPTPEDIVVSRWHKTTALEGLMRVLTPRQREAVTLRLQNATLNTIGEEIGITKAGVSKLLSVAAAKMKAVIDSY